MNINPVLPLYLIISYFVSQRRNVKVRDFLISNIPYVFYNLGTELKIYMFNDKIDHQASPKAHYVLHFIASIPASLSFLSLRSTCSVSWKLFCVYFALINWIGALFHLYRYKRTHQFEWTANVITTVSLISLINNSSPSDYRSSEEQFYIHLFFQLYNFVLLIHGNMNQVDFDEVFVEGSRMSESFTPLEI